MSSVCSWQQFWQERRIAPPSPHSPLPPFVVRPLPTFRRAVVKYQYFGILMCFLLDFCEILHLHDGQVWNMHETCRCKCLLANSIRSFV